MTSYNDICEPILISPIQSISLTVKYETKIARLVNAIIDDHLPIDARAEAIALVTASVWKHGMVPMANITVDVVRSL